MALLRASSALAYLRGRDYVIPEDILELAPDVLRHRIVLGFAARAAGLSRDELITRLLEQVPIP